MGHRQIALGNGRHRAILLVEHRDRNPPVTLPRDEPIAEAPVDRLIAEALIAKKAHHPRVGLAVGLAVEWPGVLHHPVLDIGLGHGGALEAALGMLDDHLDLNAVLAGKQEVALIVGRNPHDDARPILHQGVVGDEEPHAVTVHRVNGEVAGIDPGFFFFIAHPLGRALGLHGGNGGANLAGPRVSLEELFDQRMLGGQNHEGDAIDCVGARGEDRERLARRLEPEVDARALAPAEPVALLLLDVLGPSGEPVEIVQKALGVVGDLEEPLAEPALFDGRPAPPGDANVDLLVGEDGFVHRVPVDEGFLLEGKAALVHPEENPLGPAVVARMGGRKLAGPVVGETGEAELAAHIVDVALGPGGRVAPRLNGGVFGRETQSVPPHRMKNGVAAHRAVAADGVTHRVVAGVAHVQVARGIGKHHQAIVGGFIAGVVQGLEDGLPLPDLLPLRLVSAGFVLAEHLFPLIRWVIAAGNLRRAIFPRQGSQGVFRGLSVQEPASPGPSPGGDAAAFIFSNSSGGIRPGRPEASVRAWTVNPSAQTRPSCAAR